MCSGFRFEYLFSMNFHECVEDLEAVQLFKTCKGFYYGVYPCYAFKGEYSVKVFLERENEKCKMVFVPRLVHIVGSYIEDSTVALLAEALELNESVRTIRLFNNYIRDSGAMALGKSSASEQGCNCVGSIL